MKKILSVLLFLCLLLSLTACSGNSDVAANTSNNNLNSVNTHPESKVESGQGTQSQHSHKYNSATCTSPATCSCGATNGSALGHNYSGKYCTRCNAKNPYYTESTQPNHTHNYSSSVTREATCGKEGVRTYKCS